MKNITKFFLGIVFLGVVLAPNFSSASILDDMRVQIESLANTLQSLRALFLNSQLAQISGGYNENALPSGDFNDDGRINCDDMVLLKRVVSGEAPFNKSFDLNKDGRVNIVDITLLTHMLLNNGYRCAGDADSPLTLITPNGGEKWQIGNTYMILWSPYDPTRNINNDVVAYLERFVNGRYERVGKIIPAGKASLHWQAGEVVNDAGRLVEVAPGSYYIFIETAKSTDRSDAPFTLLPKNTITAELRVNGIRNSVVIERSDTYLVSWSSNAESCAITYNSGYTTFPRFVLTNLPASGSRNIFLNAPPPPQSLLYENDWLILQCSSRSSIDATAYDTVKIMPSVPPSISVISPNGGENLDLNSVYDIKIRYSNIEKITLVLYKNDRTFRYIIRDLDLSRLDGYRVNQNREFTYIWRPSNTLSPSDLSVLLNNQVWKIYAIGYVKDPITGITRTVTDRSDGTFGIVSGVVPPPVSTSTPQQPVIEPEVSWISSNITYNRPVQEATGTLVGNIRVSVRANGGDIYVNGVNPFSLKYNPRRGSEEPFVSVPMPVGGVVLTANNNFKILKGQKVYFDIYFSGDFNPKSPYWNNYVSMVLDGMFWSTRDDNVRAEFKSFRGWVTNSVLIN
jgi:hypothetical protein